jgi:hypothetical protein
MCLQCITKSKVIQKDVLPGFTLRQSTVDHEEWPLGWYGLVEMNDPTFVFPGPLLPDTTEGHSDEELNDLPDFPAGYNEFCAAADVLAEKLVGDPMSGYRLVDACMQVGYKMDDGHVHYWLMNFLAKKVGVSTESSAS